MMNECRLETRMMETREVHRVIGCYGRCVLVLLPLTCSEASVARSWTLFSGVTVTSVGISVLLQEFDCEK